MHRYALRKQIYTVIFGTDTPGGRLFDLLLIYAILLSVAAVMLDSVSSIRLQYGAWLFRLEWFFTILFSIEYIARLYSAPNRWQYAHSFFGVVDLLSVLPSYLALFFPGASYWLVIRLLRVLRIFRVLKLVRYLSEANVLMRSIYQSRRKVMVFFMSVMVLSVILGSLMFLVEGPVSGFTSIPKSIYWTIVTITTVGYGDITPHTVPGQLIATVSMLIGYSIIAIPTGILTAEITTEIRKEMASRRCNVCEHAGHYSDATFCYHCGVRLPEPVSPAIERG